MDETQSLRLSLLRARRNRLMQRLAEVNAEIDKVTDGSPDHDLLTFAPPEWGKLIDYLRELHVDAGNPSSRKIAEGSGNMVSHTTVSEALRGTRVPSWKTLRVIGNELGADEDALKRIWVDCQMQTTTPGEGEPESLLAVSNSRDERKTHGTLS